MTGERCGLGTDAFLEIAVRAETVDRAVDGMESVAAIESRRHHPRRDPHSNGVGESLTQGSGRHFDACGMAVLGMSGGVRAPLPELLQLIDRHVLVAGEMKQRVEQHRGVAGREYEA